MKRRRDENGNEEENLSRLNGEENQFGVISLNLRDKAWQWMET